jgi:hypothetical protein
MDYPYGLAALVDLVHPASPMTSDPTSKANKYGPLRQAVFVKLLAGCTRYFRNCAHGLSLWHGNIGSPGYEQTEQRVADAYEIAKFDRRTGPAPEKGELHPLGHSPAQDRGQLGIDLDRHLGKPPLG